MRTAMDRKGGHLAVRKSDGRLILRDTAQTAPEEMHFFTDEFHHPYFHTNNLWFDLIALRDLLVERRGVLGLPLIRNVKTADPKDPATPEVYQIETAMGAAIEVFQGAQAIAVPRGRFLPVKTTNELLLLRSDVYQLADDGVLTMVPEAAPVVTLGGRYQKIADFESRFPAGAPSLKEARSLTVDGDWTFGADVHVTGDVTLEDTGTQETVPTGYPGPEASRPASARRGIPCRGTGRARPAAAARPGRRSAVLHAAQRGKCCRCEGDGRARGQGAEAPAVPTIRSVHQAHKRHGVQRRDAETSEEKT